MPSEADTCRKHVVSLLQSAGWDNDPHSIAEQRTITDGRIVLKLAPISSRGQVSDIIKTFGGAEKLRSAVNQLQTLLYAA